MANLEIKGKDKKGLTLSEIILNYTMLGVGTGEDTITNDSVSEKSDIEKENKSNFEKFKEYTKKFWYNQSNDIDGIDTNTNLGPYKISSSAKTNFTAWVDAYNRFKHTLGLVDAKAECIFMGQILHESGNFKYMEELGTPGYFSKYDNRLGNGPGEGYLYRGRGPIQVTGKSNYDKIYTSFFSKVGMLQYNIVQNPNIASDPYISSLMTIGWCNETVNGKKFIAACNRMSGKTDIRDIVIEATRAVNGGTNGLEERYNITMSLLSQLSNGGSLTITI